MTRGKQIRMLDELVDQKGDDLKLVIYDYWKNELEDNCDKPHYCNETYPMTLRYNYKIYVTMSGNKAYEERYLKNIYRKMTVKELVESWKDETSYLRKRYETSTDFRQFYSLMADEHAYCIEKNIPESEKAYIDNYMSKHPEFKTYDDAIVAQRKQARRDMFMMKDMTRSLFKSDPRLFCWDNYYI